MIEKKREREREGEEKEIEGGSREEREGGGVWICHGRGSGLTLDRSSNLIRSWRQFTLREARVQHFIN